MKEEEPTRALPPADRRNDPRRMQLVRDSIVGFLGFFAGVSIIQATINLFQPEPALWPAVLALVLVIAAVTAWRATRSPKLRTSRREKSRMPPDEPSQ